MMLYATVYIYIYLTVVTFGKCSIYRESSMLRCLPARFLLTAKLSRGSTEEVTFLSRFFLPRKMMIFQQLQEMIRSYSSYTQLYCIVVCKTLAEFPVIDHKSCGYCRVSLVYYLSITACDFLAVPPSIPTWVCLCSGSDYHIILLDTQKYPTISCNIPIISP